MELKQRPALLSRIDPTYVQAKTPSPVHRSAQPQDLLGAPPATDVAYISEFARALMGPDAASVDAPFQQYSIRGALIDTQA